MVSKFCLRLWINFLDATVVVVVSFFSSWPQMRSDRHSAEIPAVKISDKAFLSSRSLHFFYPSPLHLPVGLPKRKTKRFFFRRFFFLPWITFLYSSQLCRTDFKLKILAIKPTFSPSPCRCRLVRFLFNIYFLTNERRRQAELLDIRHLACHSTHRIFTIPFFPSSVVVLVCRLFFC